MTRTFTILSSFLVVVSSAWAHPYDGLQQSLYGGQSRELAHWVGVGGQCPFSGEVAERAVHQAIEALGVTPAARGLDGIELSVTVSCIKAGEDGVSAYVRVQFDDTVTEPTEGQFRPDQGNYDQIVTVAGQDPTAYLLRVMTEQVLLAVTDFLDSNPLP